MQQSSEVSTVRKMDQAVYCNNTLFNFTEQQLATNTAISAVLQSTATLSCLCVIVFILCTRLYQKFSYRLIIYLMLADALFSLTAMLQRAPITYIDDQGVAVKVGWEGACSALAYIYQMMESAKLTIITWIVLYLFVIAVWKIQLNSPRHEVVGLVITLAVPLFKDWLPFCWNMYGLTGMWCWIRIVDDNCHPQYGLAIGLMFAVEYVPVLLISVFTAVTFVTILVRLYKDSAKAEISWRGVSDTSALKAGLPLIAFPILYMLIFLFRIGHRVYFTVVVEQPTTPFTTFWMMNTIAVGLAALIVPTTFACHPNTFKKLCTCITGNKTGRRLSSFYRRESWTASKEILGSSESDPFLSSKESNERDSLIYKSILSSTVPSIS